MIGADGDWLKIILPQKVGYVYSDYIDGKRYGNESSFRGSFFLSLDAETLENLLGYAGRRFEWR